MTTETSKVVAPGYTFERTWYRLVSDHGRNRTIRLTVKTCVFKTCLKSFRALRRSRTAVLRHVAGGVFDI